LHRRGHNASFSALRLEGYAALLSAQQLQLKASTEVSDNAGCSALRLEGCSALLSAQQIYIKA